MKAGNALLRTPLPKLVEKATAFSLSPMQHALLAIGTGQKIQDLQGAVREAAIQALGYEHSDPDSALRVLFINGGARGGKTMLASMLAAHRALVCDLSGMAPGEECRVAFVSASMAQAKAGLRYAKGFIRALGLGGIITSDRQETFTIERDGKSVELLVLRGNTGGDQVAGSWYPAICVLECAIAVDPSSNGVALDLAALEKAARPRLLPARGRAPAGLLIEETTSRDAAGPAWDRVTENHGKPDAPIVVFKATTLELRPDDRALQKHIEQERRIDPLNAEREFDCEWITSGSGHVFGAEALDAIAHDDLDVNLHPDPMLESWAGVDLGFTGDGSALAIVRKQRTGETRLASLKRWKKTKHEPLRPSQVIGEILSECARHGTRILLADVHHLEQLREAAQERGNIQIVTAPTGATGKAQTHAAAQELIGSGTFTMGRDHQLLRSLQRITATPTPDGVLKIRSPRSKTRGHGDDASALVLALYAAHHYGGRGQDPAYVIRPASAGMRALGLVDAEGTAIQRSASIEFGIDQATGRAYARPGAAHGAWGGEGSGQFTRNGGGF